MSFSNNQVEKAGEELKAFSNEETIILKDSTLNILTFWRDSHVGALNNAETIVKGSMQQVDSKAFIAKRIKRSESIIKKLERFKGMSLKNMQDIGGIRVVLTNIKDVNKMFQKLKKYSEFLKSDGSLRAKNYLVSPKFDGYRGIHIIGKFLNGDKKLRSIEIQIRTKLQHSWATSIEIVDLFTQNNLKSTTGLDEWSVFFKLVSKQFSIIESLSGFEKNNQQLLIGEYLKKILNDDQLWQECLAITTLFTKQLSNLTTIEYCFSTFANSLNFIHGQLDTKFSTEGFFLLRLNLATKQVVHEFFEKNNHISASTQYTLYESTLKNNPNWVVALVSTDAIGGIKQAYPNYFADSEVFISYINLIKAATAIGQKQQNLKIKTLVTQ